MKKKACLLLLLLLLSLSVVGCSGGPQTTSEAPDRDDEAPEAVEPETEPETEPEAETKTDFEPFTFVDGLGVTHTFDAPAERVISTYSAMTENYFHLGLEDRLIGVGTSEVYPEAVHQWTSFSYKDDPEVFIAADPDLLLVRSSMARRFSDTFDTLSDFGIRVVALDFHGDDFEAYITQLAAMVGEPEAAEKALDDYQKKRAALKARAAAIPEEERVRVFFESREKDYQTAARGSMAFQTLSLIGANNVAEADLETESASTVAPYGVERILEKAESIDVYIAQEGVMNKNVTVEGIAGRPGFDQIKAVADGRIVIIDEKLISSPTFRQLEGAQWLFETLYPEDGQQ